MNPKQCRRVPTIVARQPGTTLSRGTPGRAVRVVILLAVAAGLFLTFVLGRFQADYYIVEVASVRRAYE
jgi:hypothetical protein